MQTGLYSRLGKSSAHPILEQQHQTYDTHVMDSHINLGQSMRHSLYGRRARCSPLWMLGAISSLSVDSMGCLAILDVSLSIARPARSKILEPHRTMRLFSKPHRIPHISIGSQCSAGSYLLWTIYIIIAERTNRIMSRISTDFGANSL